MIGLTRWPSKPACQVRLTSSSLARPETAITRDRRNSGSLRSRSKKAKPSIPGIRRSQKITSGGCCLARVSPSGPLRARSTVTPSGSRIRLMASRASSWSSTTRMRTPLRRVPMRHGGTGESGGQAPASEPETRPDALDGLFGVLAGAEGGQPEVSLAARSEPRSRRAHDVGLGEQPVEEIPGAQTRRRLDPDVGRVPPAEHAEPGRLQPLADDPRVLHVEVHRRRDLLLPLRTVDRGRGPLDDVGDPVEPRG